jgi:uncharacterized FlgJ-related protein
MELEVPKWLLLHLVDTVIQLQLAITISQREIEFCQQPTFTKLKPKYKAEAQLAPTLIKHEQQVNNYKQTQEVDLNSCKEIHPLRTYIIHQVVPYLDMNHSQSTAEEAWALSTNHLKVSSHQ